MRPVTRADIGWSVTSTEQGRGLKGGAVPIATRSTSIGSSSSGLVHPEHVATVAYPRYMVSDVAGGPGWIIRGADLRPAITDLDTFRAGIAEDPLTKPIELLWTGDTDAALRALGLLEQTPRVRALAADCRRDRGETAVAVQEYDLLVAECLGTAREAVMRQHRGKALLANGEAERAVEDFERAVELRRTADPVLRASAEQGLAVARARMNTG